MTQLRPSSSTVLIATALALLGALATPATAGERLLVKEGAAFKPALVVAWQEGGGAVTLTLRGGDDASLIADQIKAKVAGSAVSVVNDTTLKVTGLALAALLDKLAALEIELDPLAALGGVGGGLAMAGPEAGGSIRASKPTELPGGAAEAQAFKPHPPSERFVAKISEVQQGNFPAVTLTLKVRKTPDGPLKLKEKTYKATVLLAGAPDLANPVNQLNLVAWYLLEGDRIEAHAVKLEGDTLTLDWLKRLK